MGDLEGPLASSLVDRVAEAIQGEDAPTRAWTHLIEAEKNGYRLLARAAIEAMREPTEAMVDAASEGFAKEALDYRERNTNAFKASIDAALSSSERK